MNSKRRNRSNAARSRSPELAADGVYNNTNFVHSAAGLVGTSVQIDTTNGSQFSGILATFSSQFDVVLEFTQTIRSESPDSPDPKSILKRMIFPKQNIVHMEIKNVDPNFASKEGTFQTDASISKFDRNGVAVDGEKELQPWVSDCNGEDLELTLGSDQGWDANDMFKRNEEKYGVRSSFDHSLAGYTLPLERSESKNYKDAEARASRIANEIERNPKTQARLEMENGDEEERFAAVHRPPDDRSSPPRGGQDKSNKYIPPVRRQGDSFRGRLNARTAPFPPGRTTAQSIEEPLEVSPLAPENGSPQQVNPNCEDNRNINSCSPSASAPPINSPGPNQPVHARSSNGARKTYMMSGYAFNQQQPRHPPPAPPIHRPLLPAGVVNPPPPPLQHGPPPAQLVFAPPLPPNPAHPSVNTIPQSEQVSQPLQVQSANHPPNQNIAMMQGMEQPGLREQPIAHVHLPPHGVPHVHPSVPVVPGYVQQAPRDLELDLRGHRNVGIRGGQAPRVFQQPSAKRFPGPGPFPPPPTALRKTRGEEVQELAEFSNNLKLVGEEEPEEKHESPPLDQWNKGRSPPSNPPPPTPDDASSALKKSTLNPNAKEFVYNPGANKPYTPRPPNTPGPSRPHTPQTPAQPFGYSPGPVPTVMMPTAAYVMQSAFPHQTQPPRVQMTPRPEITSSQMQVAAATGQPLLAPAPMQRFMAPYPNPPPQPYQQMVRMVPSQGTPVMFHPDGGPHVPYMSQHAPAPHPGGQFPQPQHQQFPATMVYSMPLPQTAMLQYFQQPHPQPGQQPHVQVIVPNQ